MDGEQNVLVEPDGDSPVAISPHPMARSPSTDRAEEGAAESMARLIDAYNRLQAVATKCGQDLPIPEIVVIGGQSEGKSSLLEAFLGFRFNLCTVEMGTRRPLILQMVTNPDALDPIFRFRDEDSPQYGEPMRYEARHIADIIRHRTVSHLQKIQAAVSSEPIIARVEYAHCSHLTVIDTPGLVVMPEKGEPETTPDQILSMVTSLAAPSHRIILFLQQSSIEWRSSTWLPTIKTKIDPNLERTVVVVSKFDNRLKEFEERSEVDQFFSAAGQLNVNTPRFFVSLPIKCGTISSEEFREQIYQTDDRLLGMLRKMEGGFDEHKYGSYVGFRNLQKYLKSEIMKRYKEAAPHIRSSLEQRCTTLSAKKARLDDRLKANTPDFQSSFRRAAMHYVTKICTSMIALCDVDADRALLMLGKTTEEEQIGCGIVSWPGIEQPVEPKNSGLRLYGSAAFMRLKEELSLAAKSMQCPHVSHGKDGHAGSNWLTKAAAEIAREAARSCFAPLFDTACDRLAFILRSLLDVAMERRKGSQYHPSVEDYVTFVAALRYSYYEFVKELSNQYKQEVRRHLDLVTSYNLSDIGADDMCSESGSAYSAQCKICGQYFGKMINALTENILVSGFVTSWRERLYLELSVKLFAVTDDEFLELFHSKDAVDYCRNECRSLRKCQKIFRSCIDDFDKILQDL